jgi:DUF4097 and DUF4098 domain-containing protein YvlB
MQSARFHIVALALLATPFLLGGCVGGVNGSVDVAAGTSVSNASTVNGSVHIESRAKADKASTVNGMVTLAEGAAVGHASTVNGRITLGEHATAGSVTTVNGGVTLDKNATVSGDVTAVNGDIDISGNAVIDGGIKVQKPNGNSFGISFDADGVPRIVIGAGATVNGALVFERPVQLYISDTAHVAGPITGATAVKFSGATPPPAS